MNESNFDSWEQKLYSASIASRCGSSALRIKRDRSITYLRYFEVMFKKNRAFHLPTLQFFSQLRTIYLPVYVHDVHSYLSLCVHVNRDTSQLYVGTYIQVHIHTYIHTEGARACTEYIFVHRSHRSTRYGLLIKTRLSVNLRTIFILHFEQAGPLSV